MSKKIFIVDDADFMVDMLSMILKDAGHKIVGSALNGPQAIEEIGRLSAISVPEIITVDFHMPRMDGMEMVRQIRRLVPNVKVVLVSAHATLPIVLKAKETGIDAFVAKPFEPSVLLETIDKLL